MALNIHIPDPVDVHAGSRLRSRRLQTGMSQQELAKAIKVTFQQLQKYEHGINRISASRLHAAACALRVPPGYFFEGLSGETTEEAKPQDPQSRARIALESEIGAALFSLSPRLRRAIVEMVRTLASADRQS